jgi:hypothetical protein
MAQLDDAAMDPDAKRASLADLKKLMSSLDPDLQKKLQAALEKKSLGNDTKATADQAKADDPTAPKNVTGDLPDDLKWAQENLAAKSAEADDKKPGLRRSGITDQVRRERRGDASGAGRALRQGRCRGADCARSCERRRRQENDGRRRAHGRRFAPGRRQDQQTTRRARPKRSSLRRTCAKSYLKPAPTRLVTTSTRKTFVGRPSRANRRSGYARAAPRTVDRALGRAARCPKRGVPLLFHYFIRR